MPPAINQPVRFRRQHYNCHHIIPKSVAVAGGRAAINHPRNFVIANTTRRGRDQSQNPHHFWHALFLHPQTHRSVDQSNPIYVPRPVFPFYPPIRHGFRSAEGLRKHLAALVYYPLPEIWEGRILEFSKAAGHKPYSVPKQFHELTQGFGELLRKKTVTRKLIRRCGINSQRKQKHLRPSRLPGDACINGKTLGPNHQPKHQLPVVESGLTTKPANKISENRKTARKTRKTAHTGTKVRTQPKRKNLIMNLNEKLLRELR